MPGCEMEGALQSSQPTDHQPVCLAGGCICDRTDPTPGPSDPPCFSLEFRASRDGPIRPRGCICPSKGVTAVPSSGWATAHLVRSCFAAIRAVKLLCRRV